MQQIVGRVNYELQRIRLFHVTCKNMLSLGSLYLRKMASFNHELNLEVKG